MAKQVILAVLLSLGAGATAAFAQLPPELVHLEPLAGDEAGLLDAVRGFDRLQCELADWDMDLAEELARSGDQDLAAEKMEEAKKRLALVEQAYTFALKRYPDNGRALTYYGELIYDYQGDHTKAIMMWKKAAALHPDLSEVFNNLGIHYSHTGDLTRGLVCFDKALELDPDNPDYLYNLCQIYLTQFPDVAKQRQWSLKKVYRTAMKMSKKAAELGQDYELIQDYAVNFFAAENFQLKADWREAARAWQWARQNARTTDEEFFTWLNEARVWIADGNKTKALACLDAALTIRPDSEVAANLKSGL